MKQFLGWSNFKLSCRKFETKQVIRGSICARISYNLQMHIA